MKRPSSDSTNIENLFLTLKSLYKSWFIKQTFFSEKLEENTFFWQPTTVVFTEGLIGLSSLLNR